MVSVCCTQTGDVTWSFKIHMLLMDDASGVRSKNHDTIAQNDRLFDRGVEVTRFGQKHRELLAGYGIALDPNDQNASRITAGLRFTDDNFFPLPDRSPLGIPAAREFRYLFVKFERAGNDYVKLNFVNKDLRYEDFNLGGSTSIEAAVSPKAASTLM